MKATTPDIISQYLRGSVPKGFQRTIWGVAPTTWNKAKVSDICRLSSGSTPRRNNPHSFQGSIPWVTSGELKKKYIFDTQEKITSLAVRESHLTLYQPGTVVIAIYGLEAEGVRGTASIVGQRCAISQACMAFSSFKDVDCEFFYYWYLLNGPIIGARYAQGTKQQNLSAELVGGIPIYYPDNKTQRKIAKILATQDKIIDLWNREIDQMRLLKMLCLKKMFPLAGREVPEVRFSGFSETWNWRKVKDVFNLLQNTPLPRSELSETHGIVGNIHYGDILTKFPEDLDLSRESLPFIRDNSIASRYSASLLQEGDIIMADTAEDELVGKCCEVNGITTQKVLAGLHTIPLRPIIHFVPRYLGYYMNTPSFHRQLIPLMQGIKVTSLAKHSLLRTNISFPKSRREQSKISQFFHVVDSIIALCQRRRDAEEQKKKALMQLLLTGVVRV